MDVPRSEATKGIDPFMTELSRVIRNWLAASTARTRPESALRPSDTLAIVPRVKASEEDPHRFFKQRYERGHPLRGSCPVYRPVIDRKRKAHDCSHLQLPLGDDGSLQRGPDCQDCGLRRVDDRSEALGAEHAEVCDSQRAALQLLLLQKPRPGPADQVAGGRND